MPDTTERRGIEVPPLLEGVTERRTLYGGPGGEPTFFDYGRSFSCSVPFVDRDGAMPSSADQVEWIERTTDAMAEIRRVWGSTWEAEDAATLLALERRLAEDVDRYARTITLKDPRRLAGVVRPLPPKARFSAFITFRPQAPDEGHWTQLSVETLREPEGELGLDGMVVRPGPSEPSPWFEQQARARGWAYAAGKPQVIVSPAALEAFLADCAGLELHDCSISTLD